MNPRPGHGPSAAPRRRGYHYPDSADLIPRAAISPGRIRNGAGWGEADAVIVREAAALLARGGPVRAADVGAGAGRLLPVLAGLADSITVIEPDPVRLAAARATAASASAAVPATATFSFVPDSVEQFSAVSGQLDLVLCSHVIQHVASDERPGFTAALRAMTAPGGLLVIMFPVTTTSRERYLLTRLVPAAASGPGVRTTEVRRAEFDHAVAAPARPTACLPTWHAGRGQVEGELVGAGFGILRRITYRSFTFGLTLTTTSTTSTTSSTGRRRPREVRVRGADMCVVARPTSKGRQWRS